MRYLLAVLCLTAACATVPLAPPKLDARVLDLQVAQKPEPVEPHVGVYRASFTYPKVHHHLLGSAVTLMGPGASSSSPTFASMSVPQGGKICLNDPSCTMWIDYDGTQMRFMLSNADYFHIVNSTGAVTALQGAFTSSVGSGNNAFAVATNGARVDIGAGATDYMTSDGSSVTSAGSFNVPAGVRLGLNGATNTIGWVYDGTNIVSGTSIQVATGGTAALVLASKALINTAPTISSGFGTSPSIVSSNGSLSFQINVGTGGVATTGVIGLPTATNGWVCTCEDVTTQNTTVARTRQTGLGTTTTCPIGDFTSADVAGAWVASDKLTCIAVAY